jgi:hypothetical protein
MMVSDSALIVKIEFMSEGISAGEALSKKNVTLYDLCKLQITKQDHYDFGFYASKSVFQ